MPKPTSAKASAGQQPATVPQAPSTHAWPAVADRALLGKPIKRVDGPDKARGAAKYTADIVRPGMLYGRILGSPHARARVTAVDTAAAQRLPGVKAILVIKDPADP